ncbi:unnamed protein product [Cuscuta campestris]|uniref:F-box domain-containing protein n=1 Tax=Cuscuta campestris TaxID=132261 RepID=A0A484MH57_9ASTE|nr:unnamed protein product [Cuscuta campestris]
MSSSAAANANKPPSTAAAQRTFCVSSNPDPNPAHHNTTFVQADPSNFRAVVQRLTGAGQDPSAQKLPKVSARKTSPGEMGPRRPAFKLHERRQAARKLEISLGHCGIPVPLSPSAARPSPVSPLDIAGTSRTPRSPMEVEEERGIAEKGERMEERLGCWEGELPEGEPKSEDEKMMKNVNGLQPFTEIPSDLLWEILGRVSIKTCLACKLVCKEWYRMIINPEFSSFRRHCIPSRFTIVLHDGLGARWGFNFCMLELEKALNVDDSGNCVMGVHDLIRFEKPNIYLSTTISYVMSHCNGVLCFVSTKGDYIVCKLLTGQCVKLQNLHKHRNQNQSSDIGHVELGCFPVSGQSKALILLWDKAKNTQVAKIQTLGNGEWRTVGNAPLKIRRGGRFVNGSSHWHRHTLKCIWCFHFGKEKFSEMPLPDDVINGLYGKGIQELSVFDSCLCFGCSSKGGVEIDIWVMKEYGVKESWVRQFVIVTNNWCVPLAHMDKGNLFVRNVFNNEFYLYDPQTQVLKRVEIELDDESYDIGGLPVAFDVCFSRL